MSGVSDMGLSQAQEAAVTDTKPQVLVAAAAGSGKTRLLVAAVVKALVDEQLPVERLVAVTFTRKAGAELASRVREALHACGRPDLARALDSAAVGTIDSLCRRLVKDQALSVGVDPACAVLEAEAAELVKKEVIGKCWEAAVEQADETALEVLAAQGKNLCKEVVALYDRLRGLGQDEPQIIVPVAGSEEKARALLAEAMRGALAAGAANPKPSASLVDDLDKVRRGLDWLEGATVVREGEAGLRASAGLFPSRRTRGMEEHFEPLRSALAVYRCVLVEAKLRPLVDVVNKLLAEFHRRYTTRKAEQGLVDFADLELKARALLAQSSPGEGAGPLCGSYLLVDEFQDTNELQCTILSGLGAERALMVGDERQSIYRFRGADVDVFKKRRGALASGVGQGPPGGLHRLDVNYRSAPEILEFVNILFSQEGFFGESFALLASDPDRVSLLPGGAQAVAAAAAQVLVAERRREGEGDGRAVPMQQAEAEALAAHVRAMVDQDGWRQRDVVVLLPTQTQVELYKDALEAQGLEAYLVRGKGYYAQEEVTDVICLLRLLLNPHDDLSMVSVLRSPLVGMSDDGLYLLGRERRVRKARSLWEVMRGKAVEALGAVDQEALALLVERTARIRLRVGRPGLARLIDDTMSAFSYDLCLLAAPDGARRFANVRKLMRLAEEFELATGPDLAAFLSVIRSTEQVSDREGSAPTLGEGDDVVRVMTVHQAKGLEFPVVVLAGLGADGHRPETSTFAVGSDGLVGLFLKGYRNHTYEAYDPHWGPAAQIAAEEVVREQEEDVRLLYVAMTRAQERLVLVGARPTKDSMEGSRIGRIVASLGLSAFPASGEVVCLEGLSAEVVGVAPAAARAPAAKTRAGAPKAGVAGPSAAAVAPEPGPPRFLELPSANSAPTRLSFSALAAYQRCPRQFYLERVLGVTIAGEVSTDAQSDPETSRDPLLDAEEALAGRDVGILVHRLLEQSAVSGLRPDAEAVCSAAAGVLGQLGVRLTAQELERAIALTLAVWDSPVAGRLGLESAVCEAPFLYAVGGTVVSGVMDLLCREPGRWLVTDYKTNALRGRPVAEVAEPYALQCAVYGLAALRAGAPAVQMDLLFLEDPSAMVSVKYDAADVSRLERELIGAFSGLRQGSFPRRTGKECERCPVLAVCKAMVAD